METHKPARLIGGMPGFTLFWVGQFVSILGSGMTGFATTIWVFEQTGRATDLALIGFFWMVPMLVLGPLGGVFVDRYNRKLVMMLSDIVAGLASITMLVLLSTGSLRVWHLYIGVAIIATFNSMQWPAVSAAISLMLRKDQYTRANSMMDLAWSGSNIFAPLAAGALLPLVTFQGILVIDVVTFLFAIGALLFVFIPEPERRPEQIEAQRARGAFWKELAFGVRYVLEKPSLVLLQSVFMMGNFVFTVLITLQAPMILLRTGNNELTYGAVQTIGAAGGVLGALAISAWGGFKKRVHGVLLGWAFSLGALVIIGLGRPEPVWAMLPVWGTGAFIAAAMGALVNASNQAIWQSKVAPELQGRVFSVRRTIAWLVNPLAALIAGPLADVVMEPAMREGGSLVPVFGWLVGVGPGAGIALIFIAGGLSGFVLALAGYLIPAIRNVESLLPDHGQDAASEAAGAGAAAAAVPAEA